MATRRVRGGLAIALGMVLAPAAAATVQGRPSTADERAALRAEYERDLARLRAEHEKELADVRAEVAALDPKVDVLRRVIPPQFEADRIEHDLNALARAGALRPLEVKRVEGSEKVRLPDGRTTPYERFFLDVAGHDRYESIGFFFDRVRRLATLVELLTLSLEAGPDGTVRFAARLAFPSLGAGGGAAAPALPAPPRPTGSYATGADESFALEQSLQEHRRFFARVAEAAREPIRRFQAEVSAITEMQAAGSPVRFFAALTRFGAETDNRVLALSRARFGTRTVVEGLLVGAPARAGLRPALEKAGFAVDTLEVVAAGKCLTFAVEARLKPGDEPVGAGAPPLELGPSPFHGRAASACGRPEPAMGRVVARGSSGDLTVRLRDTDIAEGISGRKVWTSPVVDARATVYASAVPWDVLLEGIAASVGMTAVIEADRLFVGPAAIAKAPWISGAVEVDRSKATDDAAEWGRVTAASKVAPDDVGEAGGRAAGWKRSRSLTGLWSRSRPS